MDCYRRHSIKPLKSSSCVISIGFHLIACATVCNPNVIGIWTPLLDPSMEDSSVVCF